LISPLSEATFTTMKTLLLLLTSSLVSCSIEKPPFESISKNGKFEVRKYQDIRIVTAPLDTMENRDQSFRKLFRYISGDNQDNQKISMTSPVFMENQQDKKTGKMSFMLPAKIAEKGAPSPDADDLSIQEIKSGKFATLRFSGWKDPAKQQAATKKLTELITHYKLKPIGSPIFAFYDPPWIPELLRQNEIWQRIED
jgi:DNA gyrase inhibitor GyrI